MYEWVSPFRQTAKANHEKLLTEAQMTSWFSGYFTLEKSRDVMEVELMFFPKKYSVRPSHKFWTSNVWTEMNE